VLSHRKSQVLAAGTGLVVLGIAVAWFGIVQVLSPERRGVVGAEPARRTAALGQPPTPDQTSAGAMASEGVPSFDVIRVEPTGEAVIAGRSAPGATVRMLRDGETYDQTVADASGFFAFVPPLLPPGAQQVVLEATSPDGTKRQSRDSATIVVNKDRNVKALIALTSPGKPTAVLSAPETTVSEAPLKTALGTEARSNIGSPLKIAAVDVEAGGQLMVSSQSTPAALVRLYLNESLVASANAPSDGKVSFAIGRGVQAGAYRIRLDDVDPVSGAVKARSEVNFTVPVEVANSQLTGSESGVAGARQTNGTNTSGVIVPQVNTAIVSKRESLWQISSRVYGKGLRYTEIYQANQKQIRNPDLIYPAQIFVLPNENSRHRTR
jgi:hypothetical protein